MTPLVKICGLTDEDSIDVALDAGADFLGFVFFDKSPRNVTAEQAAELTQFVEGVEKVGLFVNPTDEFLAEVLTHVRLDILQFHGDESPERLDQIRQDFAIPVMKSLAISDAEDLRAAEAFFPVVDYLLFDATPPKGSDRPGGNAVSFDWTLLQAFHCPVPWLLAGGLTPENVAEALRVSGAAGVDVSSGVEKAPGIKDAEKIRRFIAAIKQI